MRIATWNVRKGRPEIKLPAIWEAYSPDIVAAQEPAKPTGTLAEQSVWKGTNRNQGSLVWTAPPYMPEVIAEFVCETDLYLAVRIHRDGRHVFNVVNLWVKPNPNKPLGHCPYGYSLCTALEKAMNLLGHEVTVVLGDTNILNPDSKDYYRAFLGDFGLFSAYHEFFHEAFGHETKPTHRQTTRKTDHHIDFLFLPTRWRKYLKAVNVGSLTEWTRYSDHCPIVVDVDDDAIAGKSPIVKKRRRPKTTAESTVPAWGVSQYTVWAGNVNTLEPPDGPERPVAEVSNNG